MTIKFRYSLLTLLVLTALLAAVTALVVVGAKHWRGPHHVVERTKANEEEEYTYTRDWYRHRTIQGPLVKRRFEGQKLVYFAVIFYRQGDIVDWAYRSGETSLTRPRKPDFSDPNLDCPLSAEELREFHQVRDAELQRFLAAGGNTAKQDEGGEFIISGGLGRRSRNQRPTDSAGD